MNLSIRSSPDLSWKLPWLVAVAVLESLYFIGCNVIYTRIDGNLQDHPFEA